MWRWMILLVLLGVKVRLPCFCIKFNYVTRDNAAVQQAPADDEALKFRAMAPYAAEEH